MVKYQSFDMARPNSFILLIKCNFFVIKMKKKKKLWGFMLRELENYIAIGDLTDN